MALRIYENDIGVSFCLFLTQQNRFGVATAPHTKWNQNKENNAYIFQISSMNTEILFAIMH